AIRFNESTVRPMGRNATGVRGVSLGEAKNEVIGMVCIQNPQETILVVSEKGYGKRSDLEDYRVTNRGGKGVKTINITDKTGDLIAIKSVNENDHLMIINKSGITIRMEVNELRVMGRATQGVRLIRLDETDSIASVAKIEEIFTEEDQEAKTDVADENLPGSPIVGEEKLNGLENSDDEIPPSEDGSEENGETPEDDNSPE
ncbi:MAG: DNA gyrase C-terminal beta-propeller domain-containing protein, partial [Bacteroidota bacterium]